MIMKIKCKAMIYKQEVKQNYFFDIGKYGKKVKKSEKK